jgi:hypothetical protein
MVFFSDHLIGGLISHKNDIEFFGEMGCRGSPPDTPHRYAEGRVEGRRGLATARRAGPAVFTA